MQNFCTEKIYIAASQLRINLITAPYSENRMVLSCQDFINGAKLPNDVSRIPAKIFITK
jgi:hypothetical protein